MLKSFKSDNTAPACEAVLTALVDANRGACAAYGDDSWTAKLDAAFSRFFETEVRVFPVSTGTAANSIALATLAPPYGAIYCHREAHIFRDEAGAPEFMTGGARLMLLDGADGRLSAASLAAALDDHPASVHTPEPAVVSISQATECGTSYRREQLLAISELAHSRGLAVHMDGARFANSLVFLGGSPADVTWRAGVDVLSFGATKNGALAAEAVVLFDLARVRDFERRRKRAGHLLSKMRFVSAQLLAYLHEAVWRRNAEHANSLAAQIATSVPERLIYPVEANEVFLHLSASEARRLRAAGFAFYDWGPADGGAVRLVVSWDQSEDDVASLRGALQSL